MTSGPDSNLSRYLQEIRSVPMLTPEEEYNVARQLRRNDEDTVALKRLVESHLRFVAKIANGYRGYGLPLADLIAEGNLGMMQAVQRFDPERGFRLATYAIWWIKAAIQEYILHSWSLVKVGTTNAQKKLFFNLRKVKTQLRQLERGQLTQEEAGQIAQQLSVSEQEVFEMDDRLYQRDLSLNVPVKRDSTSEWQNWLAADHHNQEIMLAETQESEQRQHLLQQGLEQLYQRERDIFYARRLNEEPVTLDKLSEQYGISRERVRQIEARAFHKLQKWVRRHADGHGLLANPQGEAEKKEEMQY